MANSGKYLFKGIFSQLVILVLLLFFILIAVAAMFTLFRGGGANWAGMTAEPLAPEQAAALGIPANLGGVMLKGVEGPAQMAGVLSGDVLMSINGQPVQSMADFSLITGNIDVQNQGAQLDLIRQGQWTSVFIQPIAMAGGTLWQAGGMVGGGGHGRGWRYSQVIDGRRPKTAWHRCRKLYGRTERSDGHPTRGARGAGRWGKPYRPRSTGRVADQ